MLQNLKKFFIYSIILFNYCFSITFALRCYTCSYVAPDTDQSCINNPEAVLGRKITSCSKKYCTILRQETIKPVGKVVTFLRSCEDKPTYLNDVKEDATHKYYYRSCTSDLCNSGPGTGSSGSPSDPDSGAGENMKVPGRNNSIIQKLSNGLMLLAIVFIILFQ